MAFKDFAETQYIKTIDTSESISFGSFSVVNSMELAHIRSALMITGVSNLSGNEQVRLKIYTDPAFTSLLYTSDYANLSDITDIGTTNWFGWIRIDFNRENINANLTYYVQLETLNYTRNAETFWIGFSHDFPFPVYDNAQTLYYKHPLAMQLFGYTRV